MDSSCGLSTSSQPCPAEIAGRDLKTDPPGKPAPSAVLRHPLPEEHPWTLSTHPYKSQPHAVPSPPPLRYSEEDSPAQNGTGNRVPRTERTPHHVDPTAASFSKNTSGHTTPAGNAPPAAPHLRPPMSDLVSARIAPGILLFHPPPEPGTPLSLPEVPPAKDPRTVPAPHHPPSQNMPETGPTPGLPAPVQHMPVRPPAENVLLPGSPSAPLQPYPAPVHSVAVPCTSPPIRTAHPDLPVPIPGTAGTDPPSDLHTRYPNTTLPAPGTPVYTSGAVQSTPASPSLHPTPQTSYATGQYSSPPLRSPDLPPMHVGKIPAPSDSPYPASYLACTPAPIH